MKILIKKASFIVTLNKENKIYRDQDLYIEDKIIKDIGSNLNYPASEIIYAQNKLILPGLINTHHHLFQTLTRSIRAVKNAPLFDWLKYLYRIWKNITPEVIYISALLGLSELLLTGCTTTTDMLYIFPKGGAKGKKLIDEEIKAAQVLGMRFHPARGSMSRGKSKGGLPPDEIVQDETEILEDSERIIKRYHDKNLYSMCRIALGPCSPFSVTPSLMKETEKLARTYQVRLHTHLAETKDEERYCREIYNQRPFEFLEKHNWLGEDVWLAHAIYLNAKEIKKLAQTKTKVAHCPTSNMRLGSGTAPVSQMLKGKVSVGLGVDGSASNDSSNMLAELRNCLLIHQSKGNFIDPIDILKMAAPEGAKVLGREEIGSIEKGMAADIILINLNQIGYAGAMDDPVSASVLCGDSQIIDISIVNGEIAVKDGRLTQINQEELIKEANIISQKLLKGV